MQSHAQRIAACGLFLRSFDARPLPQSSCNVAHAAFAEACVHKSHMIGDARFRGLSSALVQGFIPTFPTPALLGLAAIARADLNPEGVWYVGLKDSTSSRI